MPDIRVGDCLETLSKPSARDEWWALCPMDTTDRRRVMARVLSDQKYREATGWSPPLLKWWDAAPSHFVQPCRDSPRKGPALVFAPRLYVVLGRAAVEIGDQGTPRFAHD